LYRRPGQSQALSQLHQAGVCRPSGCDAARNGLACNHNHGIPPALVLGLPAFHVCRLPSMASPPGPSAALRTSELVPALSAAGAAARRPARMRPGRELDILADRLVELLCHTRGSRNRTDRSRPGVPAALLCGGVPLMRPASSPRRVAVRTRHPDLSGFPPCPGRSRGQPAERSQGKSPRGPKAPWGCTAGCGLVFYGFRLAKASAKADRSDDQPAHRTSGLSGFNLPRHLVGTKESPETTRDCSASRHASRRIANVRMTRR